MKFRVLNESSYFEYLPGSGLISQCTIKADTADQPRPQTPRDRKNITRSTHLSKPLPQQPRPEKRIDEFIPFPDNKDNV